MVAVVVAAVVFVSYARKPVSLTMLPIVEFLRSVLQSTVRMPAESWSVSIVRM